MKRLILICSAFISLSASAQTNKSKAATAKTPQVSSNTSGTLSQTSANAAKAPVFPAYDPMRRLNYGRYSNLSYSNGRPLGLPRGTYGFGNGQLYLRSTDATTSGGITGSGSVGTGSSVGTMGTAGMAMGVNGKSPYAGPTMWGSTNGMLQSDSLLRSRPVNKKN